MIDKFLDLVELESGKILAFMTADKVWLTYETGVKIHARINALTSLLVSMQRIIEANIPKNPQKSLIEQLISNNHDDCGDPACEVHGDIAKAAKLANRN